MVKPTYTLEVDWDNDGDFLDTGEDVSSRISSMEWRRGRDYASQLNGRSVAGKLTAFLDNSSEDYSSFNTSSPIFGNVLPARKVQLTVDSKVQWTGFLERIMPIPSLRGKKLARLEAWGPLGYLNEKKVSLAMATSKVTGTAIGDVLTEAGWPVGERDIDAGQTTMARFWIDRFNTLSALRVVERSESGFLREKKNGDIRFEDRHARLKSPHTVSQATFSDATGATLGYSKPGQEDPLPAIFNEFEISVQTYSVGSLAVLWTHPESGASSPLIAPGQSKTFWANYPTPDAATDDIAVDAWTTPVENTDYEANTQSGGGGTDVSSDLAVVVTKFANAMKIVITNNGSSAAYITLLQARGTPVTKDDPVRLSAEDATSQTKYGERTFNPTGPHFIPDSIGGQDWCDFHLSIAKDPVPVLRIRVSGNRDQAHLDEVLDRDISDRITLVATSRGTGLGINEDFFIESEHHVVGEDGLHWVTWTLSPASGYSNFWILDTSKLDTETVLAY